MNCKPGDLAVVVRAVVPCNIGRVVRVTRFIGCVAGWKGDDIWEIEMDVPPLYSNGGLPNWYVRDSNVRPLLDNPGQDETLTWKDVPSTTKETA